MLRQKQGLGQVLVILHEDCHFAVALSSSLHDSCCHAGKRLLCMKIAVAECCCHSTSLHNSGCRRRACRRTVTVHEDCYCGNSTQCISAQFRLPQKGMPANVAYQMIKDIRQLDGNPRLDLASFTTTWMASLCLPYHLPLHAAFGGSSVGRKNDICSSQCQTD